MPSQQSHHQPWLHLGCQRRSAGRPLSGEPCHSLSSRDSSAVCVWYFCRIRPTRLPLRADASSPLSRTASRALSPASPFRLPSPLSTSVCLSPNQREQPSTSSRRGPCAHSSFLDRRAGCSSSTAAACCCLVPTST